MKLTPISGLQPFKKDILLVFPGALGDFICFLPALEKLVRGKRVELFARAEYADLAPVNVATYSLERYEISRLFVSGAEEDQRLRNFFGSYTFVYSWMGSSQTDFVSHLRHLTRGRVRIFPFSPSRQQMPMVDYYLSCVGEKPLKNNYPKIPLQSDALDWCRKFWQRHGLEGKEILLLAPGSGAKEKNWPIQFYRVVAEWWEKKFGRKVMVLLGPVEEERGEIETSWDDTLVVRSLNLANVVALLSRCDLYLGNDSGITHLAAAIGIQTVALFGPTDPRQWRPNGMRVRVLTQNMECSPCFDSNKNVCPHRECLTLLSPVEVIKGLEEAMRGTPAVSEVETAFLTRGGCRD